MLRFFALTFAALLVMSGNCFSADSETSATTPAATTSASNLPPLARIGVVDLQTVATESEPAKVFNDEMEKKYGKDRDSLDKRGQALKKQAESLKNPKISEQKKVDFIKTKQKLDQDARNFTRKVQQDEVKNRQDMITLIFSAAYEVARAKGYNFIVDVNAGGVLYADRSMDLTQAVLEQVNKIYRENKDKKPQPASKEGASEKGK